MSSVENRKSKIENPKSHCVLSMNWRNMYVMRVAGLEERFKKELLRNRAKRTCLNRSGGVSIYPIRNESHADSSCRDSLCCKHPSVSVFSFVSLPPSGRHETSFHIGCCRRILLVHRSVPGGGPWGKTTSVPNRAGPAIMGIGLSFGSNSPSSPTCITPCESATTRP